MPDKADLFETLDSKHPLYRKWSDTWAVYRDVIGDDEPEKTDYLQRNKLEPTDQFDFRVKISEFIPESPRAIARLVGALYKEKPKRELKDEGLDTFAEDVDLEGQNINSFMERVIAQLLGYGTLRILLNVRGQQDSLLPVDDMSRADEMALGVRPYAIAYSPLNVIDWDMDDYNKLTMIRIKEEKIRKVNPGDPESETKKIIRFIHYDRQRAAWWEFESNKGKYAQIGGAHASVHGLGFVPMIVAYWPNKIKPMIGSGYIRWMSKADVQKFRCESDQIYDAYLHAHPTLKIHTQDELGEVGVGSGSYLKLHPGGSGQNKEDATYVEAPTSAFDALKDLISQKLETIQRHANTDPLGVLEPGTRIFQASGVARAWSFGTSEARILSDIADTAAQIERDMYEVVLRLSDKNASMDKRLFKGEVIYPEEFDLSSTASLIEETEKISQMINSPTLLRTLHKRIAASKIGDASPKTVREVNKEIDDNDLINTQVGNEDANDMRIPDMGGMVEADFKVSKQGQREGSFEMSPDAKP
jgi:hypothetical protein